MNIGVDHNSSYIDDNGVSILSQCLQATKKIKCHFSANDKTPNTDGYFVLNNSTYPEKEFPVQIKSTEKVENSKFKYDTSFINYVNKGVTDNPSFIFVVDTTEEKIYYKYLSEEFLKNNDFTGTEQKTVTIHFDENEIITDNNINLFIKLLKNIVLSSKIKKFNSKGIDMAEYQFAYDKVNSFFDNDFKRLKDKAFPNVWKFGIIYNREKLSKELYEQIKKKGDLFGIKTSPYESTSSVYKIEYGSNQNVFQNLKLSFDEDKVQMPLHISNYISSGIGTDDHLEEDITEWLGNTFKNIINEQISFISFMPNDALFEIVFNFLDYEIFFQNNKTIKEQFEKSYKNYEISTKAAFEIIQNSYSGNSSDKKIKILKSAIAEIIRRDIPNIKRIWEFIETSAKSVRSRFYNAPTFYRNTYKLFTSIPDYYNEFIGNLFSAEYLHKYKLNGKCSMYLDIRNIGGNQILKDKYYKCDYSLPFQINIIDNIQETRNFENASSERLVSSIINASFINENNIANNLLSLLYQKVCSIYSLKKEKLRFKSDF